ncbi:MAG: hypothetical protein RSB59_07425, partial [Clostridia bacterium]
GSESKIENNPKEAGIRTFLKNPDLVDKVFPCPKLYIIKDMWMETFPDTIYQFGRALLKKGDAFTIANSNVCEYVIISKEKSAE